MLTLIQRAESYLASNVAVSGADILIRQLLNELAEWKQTALDSQTLEALTIQNIKYHDRIRDLEESLEKIACRHVTERPLWWQSEARRALISSEENDDPGRPVPKHGSGP